MKIYATLIEMHLLLFLMLFPLTVFSDINLERHDFSLEYGMGYHTLTGKQLSNNSEGKLTSMQNPYWLGSYTFRLGENYALKLLGGIHFVRFEDPKYGTLLHEDQVLNQFGLEVINKFSPISKLGLFVMQQDHPIYFANTPTEWEVLKKSFIQTGLHYSLGQRRRIGLIWGLGIKGYAIFPAHGGNIATEGGAGGEGYARLGWVGPFGTLYQLKGMYQLTTAPNADIEFTHEFMGYCLQISHSF